MIKIDVYFQAGEPAALHIVGRTVVVIDVLRATSVMVEALMNGARGVYPAATTEDAIKLASSLGRDDTLLCGESEGLMVDGFDLGNSPREFSAKSVADKRLVMRTTNGTRAFLMAKDADRVLACCFLNLDAVVDAVAGSEKLVVVCAGRGGTFAAEDALCAGTLIRRLRDGHPEMELNDAGSAALELTYRLRVDAAFLARTEAGQCLIEIGLRDDLKHCVQLDRYRVVPEMEDRVIRVPPRARWRTPARNSLILQVGTSEFPLSDAGYFSDSFSYEWSNHGLTWNDGDTVRVSLAVIPPVPRALSVTEPAGEPGNLEVSWEPPVHTLLSGTQGLRTLATGYDLKVVGTNEGPYFVSLTIDGLNDTTRSLRFLRADTDYTVEVIVRRSGRNVMTGAGPSATVRVRTGRARRPTLSLALPGGVTSIEEGQGRMFRIVLAGGGMHPFSGGRYDGVVADVEISNLLGGSTRLVQSSATVSDGGEVYWSRGTGPADDGPLRIRLKPGSAYKLRRGRAVHTRHPRSPPWPKA